MKTYWVCLWMILCSVPTLTYGTIEDPNAFHQGSVQRSSYASFPCQGSGYPSDEELTNPHTQEDSHLADLTHLLQQPYPQNPPPVSSNDNWAYRLISCLCWPCENSDEF